MTTIQQKIEHPNDNKIEYFEPPRNETERYIDRGCVKVNAACGIKCSDNIYSIYRGMYSIEELCLITLKEEWQKDLGSAIDDFNAAITLDAKCRRAYYCKGRTNFMLQKYSEALQDYNNLIRLSPYGGNDFNDSEDYFNRGKIKSALGDSFGAIKDYDKVIQLEKEESLQVCSRFAYYNKGIENQKTGNYAGAVADFHKALMIELRNTVDYILEFVDIKKPDKIIKEFSEIIDRVPLWAEAEFGAEVYFYRGRAKFLQDDLTGALEDFENSINLCPEGASSYNARGALYIEQGLNIKALNDLNTSISLCDEEADFYYNRAIAKFALGLKDSAYDDLRKAEELGMENVFDFDDEEDLEPII